jgi:hypothetical protein
VTTALSRATTGFEDVGIDQVVTPSVKLTGFTFLVKSTVLAEAATEKSPLTEVRVGEPVTNRLSTFKSMVVSLPV